MVRLVKFIFVVNIVWPIPNAKKSSHTHAIARATIGFNDDHMHECMDNSEI